MPPEMLTASPRRARRVALLVVGASLVLAAGGALWFLRFASQVRRDPALVYREPATLEKLLKRATDAERAGDRATAIMTYRFVMAVGQGSGGWEGRGGRGGADLAPYVVAARAGLTRLGAADTLSGPPR
jgi:hypothetical protein